MSNKTPVKRLCAFFLVISLLLPYFPSPAYAMESDDGTATNSSNNIEENVIDDIDEKTDVVNSDDINNLEIADTFFENEELSEPGIALFNVDQGENVEENYSPVITQQPAAESENVEYSEFGGIFLEVVAEATGGGELSYRWYRVSSPEDEELGEDYVIENMCLPPANVLGTNQFYCIVTNTVNGKEYSVKTDVVTINVYKAYIAKLELYKDEEKVLDGQGYWQGKEFNVTVDDVNTYKLDVLPINKSMVAKYSMSISYNGEPAEVSAYQQSITLDTSKFPIGTSGYFTVQVGEYDSSSECYIASETYRFNVTQKGCPPVITQQPVAESENVEYSEFGGIFLEVVAEATGGGELSYHWYKVSSPEDEELGEDYVIENMCLPPANVLGTNQFYCIVTNTVNGKEYSVKTDVVTINVYKAYIAKLELYKDEEKVLDGQGYWQGKEFNVTVNDANTYKLDILPISKSMVAKYSMTVSYNGEPAEVSVYQQSITLDTSKFPIGSSGCFTVQVGEYDSGSKTYIASEVYKFKVTKELSLTSIAITADDADVIVDMSEAENSGKVKTSSAVTADEIKLTVTANSNAAKVYLGNSTTAFVSGSTVKLSDYQTEVDTQSYVKIPVKLEIPAVNGQAAVTKEYTLWVLVENYYPIVTGQPQSIAEKISEDNFAVLEVEAMAKDGELSYQWYKVSKPTDVKLDDDFATMEIYAAPIDVIGSNDYYCIVTNTVNGKEYSVKTDVATVTAYKPYMRHLSLLADNCVVSSNEGSWKGGTFDVAINDRTDYTLNLTALDVMGTAPYSTTISYNGEPGVRTSYKSSIAFDAEKIPYGDSGSFTIEIGEYSIREGRYTSSETYRFSIHKYPGLKEITVTENSKQLSLDTDLCAAGNMQATRTKTTQTATGGAVSISVTPIQSGTKIYIGNKAEASAEATINPADYSVVYDGQYPYAIVPVKLVAPNGTERTYTILVQIGESRVKISKQPSDVTCYAGDHISLSVEALSLDAGTLSYQWYKGTQDNGELISNATDASFAPATDTVGEATYYCLITNTNGGAVYSVKSDIATVCVKDSSNLTPVILSQPESRITCNQGDSVILSIEVLNPPKGQISYQWYTGNIAIEDDLSAKTKDFKIPTDRNRGSSYRCVITNSVDGKEFTTSSGDILVSVKLTEYIKEPKIIGQPGTYVFDRYQGVIPGGYNPVSKGDSIPAPFYVRFEYYDYDIEATLALYHSTANSYEGGVLVENARFAAKAEENGNGRYCWEYEVNPNTDYPRGEHFFYVVVTLSPSDKNSNVEPVSTKSDILKIDFTDREVSLEGAGSESNPYLIKTPDDLAEIQKLVSEGDPFAGAYFSVVNNITFPDNWEPIGTSQTPFAGNIDGNGNTLTVPAGGLPLLGYVKDAYVENLNIKGERIEGAGLVNNYTGVGLSGNAITIENVRLLSGTSTLKSGLVASSGGNGYACASAGFTVTIRDCVIEEGVTIGYAGDQSQIGSFAGRINGTIENCTSSATVNGRNYVGGILGTRDNAMSQCVVKNSAFHGTVEASGSYVGGIVGGGYDNQTAPNGACPTIMACNVDGTVKGSSCVGGIFGGDQYVAQTWDNVVGSISANTFTGKVSGNQYVGAIIGYRNSLNRYDNIAGNTFSAGCGADKGIGFVKYLDTSYENPTKMDGTVVINTANGVDSCPAVEGCAWREDHNRTDDPLGKDADALCRKIGGTTERICYELKVEGSFKTEYNAGEELNLTGIQLTAFWTDGTTSKVELKDVKVEGYDKDKEGDQTISLSYGAAKSYINVTVKPASTKITVSVSILGDSHHSDPTSNGGPHGLARGGLTTWASVMNLEADTSETVWDVIQRVAKSKGLTIRATYTEKYKSYYIEAVNGLGEFDNGGKSGWMYTVNGTHPEVGVSAKYVKNNDKIVLHYTDDYTYEEGGINYGKPTGDVAAKNVDELISKIGTVTLTEECKQKIDAARKAYDALSDADKEKVTKLSVLEAAENKYNELKQADDKAKAQNVVKLINKIGTPTLKSDKAINDAWNAYFALTEDQKKLVTNLATLQSATQKWNELKSDEVINLIDKIETPVTEKSEKAIQDARTAYDKLTEDQKELVTNYKKLTDAETALAKLVATDEDKEKAKEVSDLIEKLEDVTLDSEKDVLEARKAYDALTDLQKKLVENYDVLEAAEKKLELLKAMQKFEDPYITTGDFIENLGTPSVGAIGGEWMVIGLARSDRKVPGVEDYYQGVLDYVRENIDGNQRLHKAKSTDNSRLILALTAIGKDVTNVDGHNLLLGLNDLDFVKKQGNNGPIWALLALDCGNYPVPEGNVTRQALIEEILSVQTSDGGWAISGDEADSDMTGMALQALAPYYKTDLNVQRAVDQAVARLSEMQNDDGGFSTFYGSGDKVATSESISQVVVALAALGINPDTDERFVKNGSSAIDALLKYYVNGGGFKHILSGELDGMATEQAYYALTAYYRFLSDKTSLYDMTDVIDMGGDPVEIPETEPTVPATTEPVEVEPAESSGFPWGTLIVVLVAAYGAGVLTVTVIIPKLKKKK